MRLHDMWLYDVISALRPMWWLLWRFRVTGAELVPRQGPALVVANHACFLDPWFICMVFPRRVRFLITPNWYYKSPRWQWFFDQQGTTPVLESAEGTLESVCNHLARDRVIGVFPEGRISHDGRMQKFRSGIVYMAARSGVPVIPVGISGAYESLPRTRSFPRPHPVTLRVGRPMVFPGSPTPERPSTRDVVRFRNRLYRAVAELAGQPVPAAARSERVAAEDGEPDSRADRSTGSAARLGRRARANPPQTQPQ